MSACSVRGQLLRFKYNIETLSEVVTAAFNAAYPITRPKHAHANSWWNRKLEKFRYKTRQALQRPKRTPYPNDKIQWEAYRSLRRDYEKQFLTQKLGHGKAFVPIQRVLVLQQNSGAIMTTAECRELQIHQYGQTKGCCLGVFKIGRAHV